MKLKKIDLNIWPKHHAFISAEVLQGEGIVLSTSIGELAFIPSSDRKCLKLHPESPNSSTWKRAPYGSEFDVAEIL